MSDLYTTDDGDHRYYPFLKWGYLHTPYMIYVRSKETFSDWDFIDRFGLQGYRAAPPPISSFDRWVAFANDADWIHIADDYGYTLWHSVRTRNAIAELSKEWDVFRNWMGDCDDSFEFEYYREGKLVRRFYYEDNWLRGTTTPGGRVEADFGPRLEGEPDDFASLKASAEEMFPSIVSALGISRVTNPLQHRYYCAANRI